MPNVIDPDELAPSPRSSNMPPFRVIPEVPSGVALVRPAALVRRRLPSVTVVVPLKVLLLTTPVANTPVEKFNVPGPFFVRFRIPVLESLPPKVEGREGTVVGGEGRGRTVTDAAVFGVGGSAV